MRRRHDDHVFELFIYLFIFPAGSVQDSGLQDTLNGVSASPLLVRGAGSAGRALLVAGCGKSQCFVQYRLFVVLPRIVASVAPAVFRRVVGLRRGLAEDSVGEARTMRLLSTSKTATTKKLIVLLNHVRTQLPLAYVALSVLLAYVRTMISLSLIHI